MIIGENRKAVIENIKLYAESGQFHNKVELNDPILSAEENRKIVFDDAPGLAYVDPGKPGNREY